MFPIWGSIYGSNMHFYGGHFEFQDGRPSKHTAISEKAVSECLTLLACSLYQILTFYNAYNMWYWPKYTLKWRPFWNSKWRMKTWSKKMEPKFFGFSTPKLTKLANKINFGTKISRDSISRHSRLNYKLKGSVPSLCRSRYDLSFFSGRAWSGKMSRSGLWFSKVPGWKNIQLSTAHRD